MKKLLLSVCLCLIVSICNAFNLGELRTLSRGLVNDDNIDTSLYHFSDVLISSYVNIIQNDIVNLTWCLEGTTTYNINSGQQEYDFLSDMFEIKRITMNGVLLPQKSITKLDDDTSWETNVSSGDPSNYYIKHLSGGSKLGFDVIPSTKNYTKLSIYYIKIPTKLTSDTSEPFEGVDRLEPYHFIICLGVASYLSYYDNKPTDGDRYYKMYLDRVKDMEKATRISPDYIPVMGGQRE